MFPFVEVKKAECVIQNKWRGYLVEQMNQSPFIGPIAKLLWDKRTSIEYVLPK